MDTNRERAPVTAADLRELDGGLTVDRGSHLSGLTRPSGAQLLAQIHDGMTVIDADGTTVGTVAFVKLGDPDAITVSPADRPIQGNAFTLMANAAVAPTTDDLPTGVSGDLLRAGYLRVHARGLLSKDRFVSADVIDRIVEETVYLSVPTDDLATG